MQSAVRQARSAARWRADPARTPVRQSARATRSMRPPCSCRLPRDAGPLRAFEIAPHEAAIFGCRRPVRFEHCGRGTGAPAPGGGMQVQWLQNLTRERHAEVLRRSADVIGARAAEAPFGDHDRTYAMDAVKAVEPAARLAPILGRVGVPRVGDAMILNRIARGA